MPVMQTASRTATDAPSSISLPPPSPAMPGPPTAAPAVQTRPDPDTTRAVEVDDHAPSPPLHACPHCYTRFLTATGIERHLPTHGHEVQADGQLVRAAKIPKFDTVPVMLNKPCQHVEAPSRTFQCPLGLETVGRKALASHLSKEHQVVKPPFFVFRPSRDMTPGRLACAHCHTTYTSEAALRLHQRASCPILLIEWVKDQHFGPSVMTPAPPEVPKPADTAAQSSTCIPTSGRPVLVVSALCMPADTPEYTRDLTWPLLTTPSMTYAAVTCWHVPFWPELRLRWFNAFVNWMAHLSGLPHLDLEVSLHHRLLTYCTMAVPLGLGLSRTGASPVCRHCFSHDSLDSALSFSESVV